MNAIQLDEISFKYSKKEVLKDLSLYVPENSVYGFIGPNGAGKTTTINLIFGFLKPLKGNIHIMNEGINHRTFNKIGSLIEEPAFYNKLTCYENLKVFLKLNNRTNIKEIDEVIELFNLIPYKNKRAKYLSSGYKQRLALAIAFLKKPQIIILDEPTNSLDATSIIDLREIIQTMNKSFGTTFFISSHQLSEVEKIATHVGFLFNGNLIIEDKTSEVLSKYCKQTTYIIKLSQANNNIKFPGVFEKIDASTYKIIVDSKEGLNKILKTFIENHCEIISIDNIRVTLEDIYKTLAKNE